MIAEFNKFDYEVENNDNIFSSESLTKTVALFVSNFVKNRQDDPRYTVWINALERLLTPHGFDGTMFHDAFGVKDVLDDLSLYKESRWLFLHYELTGMEPSKENADRLEWKLFGNFFKFEHCIQNAQGYFTGTTPYYEGVLATKNGRR